MSNAMKTANDFFIVFFIPFYPFNFIFRVVYPFRFSTLLKNKKCVQTEECTHEKHKLRFATTQKT